MIVRVSSLPLALLCARSIVARPGEARIDDAGEPAKVGDAVHAGMAAWCLRRERIEPETLCVATGAPLEEVGTIGALLAVGRREFEKFKDDFPADEETVAEFALSFRTAGGALVRGHLDLLRVVGEAAGFVDWKSGRREGDYRDQVLGYAREVFENFPEVQRIKARVVWLRHGLTLVYEIDRADIALFAARMDGMIDDPDPRYSPGAHCERCPRRWSCEAVRTVAAGTIALLTREGSPLADLPTDADLSVVGPAMLDMRERVSLIKKACEAYERWERAEVRRLGGSVPVDDVRRLALVPKNKRVVVPSKAAPLIEALTAGRPETLDDIVSVSIGALEELVTVDAPKGHGAKLKRDLADKLRALGALTTKAHEELRVTAGKETTDEDER